jgi:hypothetical protein
LGLILAALVLVVGLTMVVPEPRVDVVQQGLGVVLIGLAAWLGALAITNMVRLTPAGIEHRLNFRLRTVPWDAVASFRAAPVPATPFWTTVLVELRPAGHAYLTSVWGTKRYARRVASEFEEYRTHIDAAPNAIESPNEL